MDGLDRTMTMLFIFPLLTLSASGVFSRDDVTGVPSIPPPRFLRIYPAFFAHDKIQI